MNDCKFNKEEICTLLFFKCTYTQDGVFLCRKYEEKEQA